MESLSEVPGGHERGALVQLIMNYFFAYLFSNICGGTLTCQTQRKRWFATYGLPRPPRFSDTAGKQEG